MSDWWEVLIAPVFCIAMFVYIGIKFELVDKLKHLFGGISGGRSFRPNFNVVKFEGIAKYFRRN